MKRKMVLVTVAAVMAAMMMVSAVPSFAQQPRCSGRYELVTTTIGEPLDVNGNTFLCQRSDKITGERILIDDRYV